MPKHILGQDRIEGRYFRSTTLDTDNKTKGGYQQDKEGCEKIKRPHVVPQVLKGVKTRSKEMVN